MHQNLMSLAAEAEPFHSFPTMRRHHDEIATFFLSRLDDRFVRMIAGRESDVAGHARRLCSFFND